MKSLLLVILLSILEACNYNSKVDMVSLPPEDSKIATVKLIDSLGYVILTLPKRYDTLFSWIDYSDCGKPCNKIKYRWQPKNLKITKESGWIWLGEPKDSIERFTISHSGYFHFHHQSDSGIFKLHSHEKENMLSDPEVHKIRSDTVEKIGDRYFSIITIDFYDIVQLQYTKKLLAATSIRGNTIHFNFELLTKQKGASTDSFINNSKYYLKTVRMSNGK